MSNVSSGDARVTPPDMLQKILMIGIGNEVRGDDGIGIEVARRIRNKLLPGVIVREESGDAVVLMDAWHGFDSVILVDAISSGAEPGTIVVLNATRGEVPAEFFHYSTHAFGVGEAVALAKEMGTLPSKLLLYGIEGADFSTGATISRAVQDAGQQVVECIVREVESADR